MDFCLLAPSSILQSKFLVFIETIATFPVA